MARGRTASNLSLGARREKAAELFSRHYTVTEVARTIQVSPDTAARYKKAWLESVSHEAKSDPGMLRDILRNTFGALRAIDQVVQEAWRNYAATESEALKATFLNTALKGLDQRAKLLQLFGVKAEYLAQVAVIQDQQRRLVEFMNGTLCEEDRARLENFLVLEMQTEDLRMLPETPEVTYDGASS